MNIDLNSAQKSSVVCWRRLLRALDQLPADRFDGTTNTAFVSEGVKTHGGLQRIFAFLTSDLNMNVETRQEIFCANVDDMIALKVLSDAPKDVFVRTPNPDIVKRLTDARHEAQEARKQYEENDDDEEEDWCLDDVFYEQMVEALNLVEILEKQEFMVVIEYDAYLQWLSDKLVSISCAQCAVVEHATENTIDVEPFTQQTDNHHSHDREQPRRAAYK